MSAADAAWRDPLDVVTGWEHDVAAALLRHRVRGPFWDLLDDLGITLLLSREYEHLLMTLSGRAGKGDVSHLPIPHPSGIAFDAHRGVVHVASTRNPNQILDLLPVGDDGERTLVPMRSRTLPGRLYLHDLALVGGRLYANAVGENSVGPLDPDGAYDRRWWPACLDDRHDAFDANHLQLNSIAAADTVKVSYFTASAAEPGRRQPGDKDFPVDGRGVVFAGQSREPIARGLTRPHSARLTSMTKGRLFVANSGYGELVEVDPKGGGYEVVARLPGWTRGLALAAGIAFVGTSRVLTRFTQYAPGLDPDDCVCGVHAVELATGKILASLRWPEGDQLFAIEAVPATLTSGLPAGPGRSAAWRRRLFYDLRRP